MRNLRNHQYDGENFASEKLIGTLWVIMFVLIVGSGIHTQFLRTTPGAASLAAIETLPR